MGCLIGCLGLLFPRLVLFSIFLFSDYLGRAYETNFWPFLGFVFMPLTTLAYAWAVNTHETVTGIYLVVVVIAVILDLGLGGNGAREGKKSWG
jgi:hypothetical protein